MYLLPMLLCGISQRRPSACGLGHDYILRAAVSSHMRCPAVAVHAVDRDPSPRRFAPSMSAPFCSRATNASEGAI